MTTRSGRDGFHLGLVNISKTKNNRAVVNTKYEYDITGCLSYAILIGLLSLEKTSVGQLDISYLQPIYQQLTAIGGGGGGTVRA